MADFRPSKEDELRAARRRAIAGIRRLSGEKADSTASVSPEIVPGIFKEDVGIQFASKRSRKKKKKPRSDYA